MSLKVSLGHGATFKIGHGRKHIFLANVISYDVLTYLNRRTSFVSNHKTHARKYCKCQERSDLGEPMDPVPDGLDGGGSGAADA